MAIPRGYRRNSSGFLQPVGSAPSGRVSGPRAGETGLGGEGGSGLTRLQLPKGPRSEAEKKILASFDRAQKAHESVMAGIAKAEASKFDRINDALNASKENDPKDKLGNTVPSKQTQYLEAQLLNILGQASQKGRVPTPAGAGVQPGQMEKIRTEGPGGPGYSPLDREPVVPTLQDTRDIRLGATPLPQPGMIEPGAPLQAGAPQPEIYPVGTKAVHKATGTAITLTGETKQGPTGLEYKARLEDGTEDWVPVGSFDVPEEARKQSGLSALERLLAPKFEGERPEEFASL